MSADTATLRNTYSRAKAKNGQDEAIIKLAETAHGLGYGHSDFIQDALAIDIVLEDYGHDSERARHDLGKIYRNVQENPPPEIVEDDDAHTTEKGAKKTVATVLVDMARESFHLHLDPLGRPFAVPKTGAAVPVRFKDGLNSLGTQLTGLYKEQYDRVISASSRADALAALEYYAEQSSEPTHLYQRVALEDGKIFIDRATPDAEQVVISPSGWELRTDTGVLFNRTSLTAQLPRPERGGTLEELWAFLNIEDEDRELVLAFIVATLIENIPHPILSISGGQGRGKSTFAKFLVSLLDPSSAPIRTAPRDERQWALTASAGWLYCLDNLSRVQPWLSDAMSRTATGDSMVMRALFTDSDLSVVEFRRVVMLTGIDLGALQSDLADRVIRLELMEIPDQKRKEEAQIMNAWEKARPRILGAIFDFTAKVLAALPSVTLDEYPRMADFARIVATVDHLQGSNALERYAGIQERMASESLTDHPFMASLVNTISHGAFGFEGTSADLHELLSPKSETARVPRAWPKNAREVTTLLNKFQADLRKTGWVITHDRGRNKSKTIVWTLIAPHQEEDRPL